MRQNIYILYTMKLLLYGQIVGIAVGEELASEER